MTQTFFNHFNCRQLSEQISVLRKDYDFECAGGSWLVLAVVSVLGLTAVSIGFPVGMAMWMRRRMTEELHKVKFEGKSPAVAHRDFRREFSFISVSNFGSSDIAASSRIVVHINSS